MDYVKWGRLHLGINYLLILVLWLILGDTISSPTKSLPAQTDSSIRFTQNMRDTQVSRHAGSMTIGPIETPTARTGAATQIIQPRNSFEAVQQPTDSQIFLPIIRSHINSISSPTPSPTPGSNAQLHITWPQRSVLDAPNVATLSIIDENGVTFQIPHIQTSSTLTVSATLSSSDGGVQFVLNPGMATEQIQIDMNAPFAVSFFELSKGTYTLEANIVDASHSVQAGSGASDRITQIAIGDIITAIGDSITEGWNGTNYGTTPITNWLEAPAESLSQDLRNYPQHGPEGNTYRISFLTELNDLLSVQLGYPVFIINEGRYGYTSGQYIDYMATEQWRNRQLALKPNRWLIHLGANDAWADEDAATYRTNLQTLITELQTSHSAPSSAIWLAKPSYYIGYEVLESTYLPEIDMLINANGLQAGPDFYTHYQQNAQTQYDDDIHPNLAGFTAMAELWATSISGVEPDTQTATPTATPTILAATPTPIAASTATTVPGDSMVPTEPGWHEIQNTMLHDVCPTNQFDGVDYDFHFFCPSIIAWSGGAYDTLRDRLLVWGGGHNDYYGNEVYAFDIATMGWQRLTDPDLDFTYGQACQEKHASGNPSSRHTYGGFEYITHLDRFLAHGGSLACGDGNGSALTWLFDPNTNSWQDVQATSSLFGYTLLQEELTYDPVTRLVYMTLNGQLNRYDFTTNAWSGIDDEQFNWRTPGCVIDTTRRQMICVGNEQVWSYALTDGNTQRQLWMTSGGDGIVNVEGPGVDYDPVRDRIVAWNGNAVYSLDIANRNWTAHSAPGAPIMADSSGTYGRWRYIEKYDIFIVFTHVDENVHFYKPNHE